MTKNNKNLNFSDISIIYKTKKQFWGISNHGNKKRISKKKFESLLKIKKLISYKDSKIFKRDIKFIILINKIEINLNSTRQYAQILNQTFPRYTFIDMFSGAGGLSQGLIEAGLTPELCIDDNIDSCKTLIKNHPSVRVINKKVQNFNFSKFTNKVNVLVGRALSVFFICRFKKRIA
jgi:hypothetical protein